jgi:HrpA-like RNA helicase
MKLEQLGRRIAITQPTRLTAEQIPYDISSLDPKFEMGVNIGFQTGLLNRTPPRGLSFMTTGVLVQQLINTISSEPERFIRRYSVIIVDEVHRHDLMTDVLLRLLRQFLARFWNHQDCPFVIVQSATMDPKKYMEYFDTTAFIDVVGAPAFPVETMWPKSSVSNLVPWIVETCRKVDGDTLVFLPTKKAITAVKKALDEDKKTKSSAVIEVMGETASRGDIRQMSRESKGTRIVLASNVAETGLTLPYLKHVIDTGLHNSVTYNPQYACTAIALQPVTEASAIQRRGRTGRKMPGTWWPAFTEDTFKKMIPQNPPEMHTSDVSPYLLRLIVSLTESTIDEHWAVESKLEFDPAALGLIHDPSPESLSAAYDKLYTLGLIRQDWRPTVSGLLASKMTKTAPEAAKMFLSAAYHQADLYKLVVIAACIEIGGIGDLKGFGEELYDDRVRCGFIRQLVAFEHLQRQIRKMGAEGIKKMSTAWISEWCEQVGIGYVSALRIIEKSYVLMFELMELGMRVDMDGVPLLDTLEADKKEDTLREISSLKKCIVEGYRLNICTWNEPLGSYVTYYKHAKVACRERFPAGPPLNIVTDAVTYMPDMSGRMGYNVGRLVCQLDEHVTTDPHFMW